MTSLLGLSLKNRILVLVFSVHVSGHFIDVLGSHAGQWQSVAATLTLCIDIFPWGHIVTLPIFVFD